MAEITVKTRFAPSPTGLIHLGNVRTALFCALYARAENGIFLLRIEDTDAERSKAEHTQALQHDLRWLGLDWQEGPGQEREHAPYAQSERLDVYRRYFDVLEQEGHAYFCFCSEKELEISRKVQQSAGRPPRYTGTCARLQHSEVMTRLEKGLKPTLRFRVIPGKTVEFNDLVRGPQRFVSDDIGDFIIRRADGTPAFFFSNALDDSLMNVTHVLRGEDHLANTPRQILLLEGLGLRSPHYGHISMIVGNDGSPLSKRHGSRSVRELRENGFFPGAVVNYLARLGHHFENNAYLSLEELAASFRLEHLGRSPARFDPTQLLYWQREAIAHADVATLWQWMGPEVQELVPSGQSDAFVEAIRENVVMPLDAVRWARILFTDTLDVTEAMKIAINEAGADYFSHALLALEKAQTDFKALIADLKQTTGAKGKMLFQPLRAALTGELDGPEMARILPLLSVPRAQRRLEACLSILNA